MKAYKLGLIQGKAYRILEKNLTAALAPHKLLMPEWKLLCLISDNPEAQAAQLAEHLGVKRPFITELTTKLTQRGLITRTHHPSDKRAHHIHITSEGLQLIEDVEADVRHFLDTTFQGVSYIERVLYVKILKAVIDNDEKRKEVK